MNVGVKKFPSCLLKSNSVWPSHYLPGRWNVQGRGSQFLAIGKGGNSREPVLQQYELRVPLVSIHHDCCCWDTHGVRKLQKKDRYPLQFSVVFDELGILLFCEVSKTLFLSYHLCRLRYHLLPLLWLRTGLQGSSVLTIHWTQSRDPQSPWGFIPLCSVNL